MEGLQREWYLKFSNPPAGQGTPSRWLFETLFKNKFSSARRFIKASPPGPDGYSSQRLHIVAGRIWYPATGCRIAGTGGLNSVGGGAYYCSGTPNNAVYCSNLNFSAGVVYPGGSNARGFGFAARCVSEF